MRKIGKIYTDFVLETSPHPLRKNKFDRFSELVLNQFFDEMTKAKKEDNSYLIISPIQPIDGLTFFQVRNDGDFFRVEFCLHDTVKNDIYYRHIVDQNEVRKLLFDFLDSRIVTNTDQWKFFDTFKPDK